MSFTPLRAVCVAAIGPISPQWDPPRFINVGYVGNAVLPYVGSVLSRSRGVSGAEISKAEKSDISRNDAASSLTIRMRRRHGGAGDAATAARRRRRLRTEADQQWVSQGEWGSRMGLPLIVASPTEPIDATAVTERCDP